MPLHEYQAKDQTSACAHCREPFERLESLQSTPLQHCPQCGAELERLLSRLRVGGSHSGLDDRAKAAGFTKFKRLGKGEYEKQY